MGIDYVIPHPCANREKLGEAGLRRWTFLYMIYKYLKDHPELSRQGLEGKHWNMPTIRGLENQQEKFDHEDIRKVGDEIGDYISQCRDCPANMDPKADEFGCVGRINYPIQSCFEEFLGERLQHVIDKLPPDEWPTLLNLIIRSDSPFTGEPVARLRATVLKSSGRLLERGEAYAFERAGDGISTNHVLHAMLGMISSQSESVSYNREIPKELLNIYLDFLTGMLYTGLSEARVLELSRNCSTYLQFRWLNRALRIAYRLGSSIFIH